ncbi:MAG: diguanylate cyclase [Actinobacteria bacterium]|nr:diguanylate cyclase [Actinomycetota bacterium]
MPEDRPDFSSDGQLELEPWRNTHYRTLTESAQDFIFIVGPDDKILYLNNFAAQQVGLKPQEMMGRPRCDFFPMEFTAEQRSGLRQVFESGASLSCESRAHFPHGSAWLSTTFTPLTDENGEVTAVLGISRDITENKTAEIRVRSYNEKLEDVNRELSILFDISSAISKETEIGKLLNQSLKMVIGLGLLDVQHKGGIFLIEDSRLQLAAHLGHDEAFIKAHENLKVGECLCGTVAANGKQIISSNISSDDRHCIDYPGMEPHGHVIIPLRTVDNTIGVLFLYMKPNRGIKDRQLRVLMAIGNQLAVAVEKIRLYEKTKELSLHDPLTGLANRHFMDISLKSSLAASKRTGRPFSLILMDLDMFKEYNDTFGHVAGDKLLSDVGSLLKKEVREIDLVARYGGEEFLIILPDTGEKTAVDVAERIRGVISATAFSYSRRRPPTRVTISAGVASFEPSILEEEVLIARADSALYRAKNNGRNRVMVWLNQ